jgi:hypothetical protein
LREEGGGAAVALLRRPRGEILIRARFPWTGLYFVADADVGEGENGMQDAGGDVDAARLAGGVEGVGAGDGTKVIEADDADTAGEWEEGFALGGETWRCGRT